MDFYLQANNSYNRLEEEFKKYGKLIFCVDFDDTIYDFHKKGRTYENVISLLQRWENYSEVRECFNKGLNTYPDWYIGAIGFLGSYNGRFYDGGFAKTNYSKSKTTDHIIIRNYYKEAKENLIEQIPRLEDIQFQCGDYEELYSDKVDCLFYCDIPYKGTKQYGSSKNFDYDRFWNWAEKMSERNIVLVSEHEAPSEWECIWQQEVKRTIDNTKRVKAVEKLFEIRE